MEKKSSPVDTDQEPCPLFLSGLKADAQAFYQRFVARHGGAFIATEQEGRYRLDFPPGTRKVPNDVSDPLMRSTYRLLYPDGASFIWFRTLIIDGEPHSDTLLTPIEDVERPLCEHDPYEMAG